MLVKTRHRVLSKHSDLPLQIGIKTKNSAPGAKPGAEFSVVSQAFTPVRAAYSSAKYLMVRTIWLV